MSTGKGRTVRLLVLASAAAAIGLFFASGLHRHFTLEQAGLYREKFSHAYSSDTFFVIALYFCVYVAATALSLPGAAILSLLGGAIFGLWAGVVIVSFASSLGALAACALCRFVFRDWVEKKFGERLVAINRGIENEGAFYLFGLRLVPVFPFWLVNLAMGLTSMRLRTFYWVSQLGMFPATVVFINAGKELGRIRNTSDILSPSLFLSFALLGLLPLAAKKGLGWLKARRMKSGPPDNPV
ncbi:MAG: TVP38/TMEM64 family protein [Deltaproteobacteria bacterium]|nr:TVP38/TMEM64 family protein [Deltaproteobacteria bacterium]